MRYQLPSQWRPSRTSWWVLAGKFTLIGVGCVIASSVFFMAFWSATAGL